MFAREAFGVKLLDSLVQSPDPLGWITVFPMVADVVLDADERRIKRINEGSSRLRVCAVQDQVWGVLLITGLDKIFEFTDDIATSLASLQINN